MTPTTQGRQVSPWLALAVLALGLFMTLLDLTIVNIAIPSLVSSLQASLDQILWMLNAYSLVFAVLLITAGRLGDIFGPRNLFATGLVVFTAASALSGLAQNPGELIAARAGQGLGAALLSPQGLPIMTTIFPADKRGGVFAIYGALAGLAVLAGPLLGGLIVTHLGWRWIFYVNVPVGLLALVLTFIVVPDLRPGRRHRLDLVGVALATLGLFGVIFGLIEGQRYNWGTVSGWLTIPEIIAAGVVVLAVFFFTQYRRQGREPLLPLAVFRDRNYTLMTLILAAMGFAMVGLFLPLTIYFQSVLGLSALEAGIATAPMPLAMFLLSGPVAALSNRISAKYILLIGLTLFVLGMGYIAWVVQPDSNRWSFAPGLVVAGVGLAGVWTPVYSLATRDLKPHLAGAASGMLATIQELGTVLGSAAVGALLSNRLATAMHDQAVERSSHLPPEFRPGFLAAFKPTGNLDVGPGQSVPVPPGLPPPVAHLLQQLGHDVFTNAFTQAMRPSLALPMAIVLLAGLSCLAVRVRSSQVGAGATEAEAAMV